MYNLLLFHCHCRTLSAGWVLVRCYTWCYQQSSGKERGMRREEREEGGRGEWGRGGREEEEGGRRGGRREKEGNGRNERERGRGWKEGLCKEGRREKGGEGGRGGEEREEGLSKGGRKRWREGVRQVVGHTVTVHVGGKNDLLIPFLPPSLPSFSPFPPSPLSPASQVINLYLHDTCQRRNFPLRSVQSYQDQTDLKRCSQVCYTYS